MTAEVKEKGFFQQVCSGIWGFVLLRGIALLILGVLLLSKPGITVLVLVWFLGAYFFVDGIFTILKSLKGRKYVKGWGWGIFLAIIEILAAIVVFARPVASSIITLGFLVYFIAFIALFLGLLGIITGIRLRKEIKGEWSMILGGLLAVIFGVFLLANPRASIISLIIVMGVIAVIDGLLLIFFALKLRKLGRESLEAAV
jgi:uncharacterized membrane protein HdeD (DUF308 family)